MAKKAEREAGRGVIVTTHTDAMTEVTSITVSIPPYGPGPDLDIFSEALRASEEPRFMSDARALIAEKIGDQTAAEEREKSNPLHEDAFYLRAWRELQRIDDLLSDIPHDYKSNIGDALSAAMRVGCDLTTARLRHVHLESVTREVEVMQPGRKKGGLSKRGRFKEDTDRLLAFMDEMISKGSKRSEAAARAANKGLGKNQKANEARYREHRGAKK